MKILLPGGAGLVGQNLVARLKAKGYSHIIVEYTYQGKHGTLIADLVQATYFVSLG